MNFIVVGCGRVGAELAYHLYRAGHQVVVVDTNHSAFNRLHPDFRGRTLEGEGLAESVLERAGIREADGLAAVTNSDTLNAVVAHVAKSVYGVSRVVVRNYDPALREVLQAFGLQTISSTSWGASRVEEILTNPTQKAVFAAGNGEVEVFEVHIPARWHGRTIGDILKESPGCYPVALTRAGRSTLPESTMLLEEGDLFLVSSTSEAIHLLDACLEAKGKA